MEYVDVVFSATSPLYGAVPGDRLQVLAEEVDQLVADGTARPATKADAKAAGVDPEQAASVKK